MLLVSLIVLAWSHAPRLMLCNLSLSPELHPGGLVRSGGFCLGFHIYGKTLLQTHMFRNCNVAFIKDVAVRLSAITWGHMECVSIQIDDCLRLIE